MKKIEAKIIADSVSPQGHRITTFHLTFPRHILAELNTHRMFSRNSASSRAIPFAKMVNMVEEDPFIPIAWQKDHSGMQGKEYYTGVCGKDLIHIDRSFGYSEFANMPTVEYLTKEWKEAAKSAVAVAKGFQNLGVTKQITNRLLEPFMWHSNLVTSTEWENFFSQRCPQYRVREGEVVHHFRSKKDAKAFALPDHYDGYTHVDWLLSDDSPAEIHMQALAEAMWNAYNENVPKQLTAGEWHLPFGDNLTQDQIIESVSGVTFENGTKLIEAVEFNKVKIVSARCARASYNNFDGTSYINKDIRLAEQLEEDNHMSPLEHAAKCPTDEEYARHIKGSMKIEDQGEGVKYILEDSDVQGWFNNFHGWIPYRYMIEQKQKGEPDGVNRY